MADQPRGHRVEHLAQGEPARGGHRHQDGFKVIGSPWGQRLQCPALGLQTGTEAAIAPRNQFIDELPIGGQIGELTRAAQQQRILQRLLEMSMGAFDGAVLMRLAAVVAT